MPELPEVEVAARAVARHVAGRRLARLELPDPRLLVEAELAPEALVGARFGAVWRRGKHLVMDLDRARLVWHFRMTGKLVPDRPGGHVRARVQVEGGPPLVFKDSRCLGHLSVLAPGGEPAAFARLGPEPYPQRRPGAWWAARLADTATAIKPALMQQERVAGLGNIAGSELCWRARVDPRRPACALEPAAWEALAAEAHAFLHEIIALEDGDEIAYLNDGPRGAPNPFAVYGRAGSPCPRCGDALRRFTQAGRGTFWCARCQPSPGDAPMKTPP